MEGKDQLEELFRENLNEVQLPVSDKVWAGVSSSISASGASWSSSFITKLGIGALTVVAGSVLFYFSSDRVENVRNEGDIQKSTNIRQEQLSDSSAILNEMPSVENRSRVDENTKEFVEQVKQPIDALVDIFMSSRSALKSTSSTSELLPFLDNEEGFQEQEKSTVLPIFTESIDPLVSPTIHSESISEAAPSLDITLPNVFTPNMDGVNDYLVLDLQDLSDIQLVVMNRDNRIVFTSSAALISWDGTDLGGTKLPAGDYLYYVTAKGKDGKLWSKSSSLRIAY
jgi:gliding motility-associated-like protein